MTANSQRGEVELVIDEKTYIIKFTTNALCQLEGLEGATIKRIFEPIQVDEDVSLGLLRNMLYVGLLEHHPAMTVPDAGRIMDAGGMATVFEKVFEAMELGSNVFGADEKKPQGRKKK